MPSTTDDASPTPSGPLANADVPLAGSLATEIEARLSADTLALPMLPVAAAELLAGCQRDDLDAAWLAGRVERDPSLSANVLRVANSTAMGSRERIVSLTQAVARLGLRDLRDLVLVATLEAGVFRSRGTEPALSELWEHSTLVAGWSREVARARRANVEGAFLAGLLHDVGRAVLLGIAMEIRGERLTDTDWEVLLPLFDARHEAVGGELANSWNLPEAVADAIRLHHTPPAEGPHAEVARTVALADYLARETEDEPSEEAGALAAALGLYPDELNALRDRREHVEQQAEGLA